MKSLTAVLMLSASTCACLASPTPPPPRTMEMTLPVEFAEQRYLSTGDMIDCQLTLGGNSSGPYDVYLAAVAPSGQTFFYPGFGENPVPAASSLMLSGTIQRTENLYRLTGAEPECEYSFYFAVVPAKTGRDLQTLTHSVLTYVKKTLSVNPTVKGTISPSASQAHIWVGDSFWGASLGSGVADSNGHFQIVLSGKWLSRDAVEPYDQIWFRITADGFFTAFERDHRYAEKGLSFSLDAVPSGTSIAGMIYEDLTFFYDWYIPEATIELLTNGAVIATQSTSSDQKGRYLFTGLVAGDYVVRVTYPDPPSPGGYLTIQQNVTVSDGTAYLDIGCPPSMQPLKPNIYLYPSSAQTVNVSLEFPLGGEVIASMPLYDNGWKIEVTPDGKINGAYDYLFYECANPDTYQYERGWCVAREEMEAQLRDKLAQMGFRGREVEDFIEYWVPRLSGSRYYLIFPQFSEQINKSTKLIVAPEPDSILRVFLRVIPSPGPIRIPAPVIAPFNRAGFTVAEWGVIL